MFKRVVECMKKAFWKVVDAATKITGKNYRARVQHPGWWLAIIGTFAPQIIIRFWPEHLEQFNTYMYFISGAAAYIGIETDFTTKDWGDSERALNYDKPGEPKEDDVEVIDVNLDGVR